MIHGERLRAAVAFAAVDHRAVIGGQDIIEQCRIRAGDLIPLAGLDGPELKTARGDFRPE